MIEVEWLAGCPQMGKSLKLRCSIPQCDSFFKRSFLTCTKKFEKTVKKLGDCVMKKTARLKM